MRKFNPDKELYKIKYGKRNKIILGIILLLVTISIGSTFALYQVRRSKRIIYTTVDDFSIKEPYKDQSGANYPELYQGLIPVTIEDNGIIKVADITEEWYDYENHKWANAVLVTTEKYQELTENNELKKDSYNKELNIDEDILQMFVWIPRYKYQLWNPQGGVSSPQVINIQFEEGTQSTGEVTCTYTRNAEIVAEKCVNKEGTAVAGDWYTHPAFTFKGTLENEGIELPGIWVGKFESSHTTKSQGNAIGYDDNAVLNCEDNTCVEADNIRILPNKVSLRYNNISNFFYVSQSLAKSGNPYNLNNTEIDSHLMKNMEWGAVAYLSHSKYGTCTGDNCEQVWSNNNNKFITGCGGTEANAKAVATCNEWTTEYGKQATTTKNIYGIYDMSGGSGEWVMGTSINGSGGVALAATGFKTVPAAKYYDMYTYYYNSDEYVLPTVNRGHLGDATKETRINGTVTGGWYSNIMGFPDLRNPWFNRGDSASGQGPGIFAFARGTGPRYYAISFRVVISKLN